MDPAKNEVLSIFDFLDTEARAKPDQEDDIIASNLYYVSLPYSLGILSGVTNQNRKQEMCELNEWLRAIIPDADKVFVLNFDKIKAYIPDYRELKSFDAFFYHIDSGKCFLIEFKASTKEELLRKKMLDLKTDSADAHIKKVAHSKTILEKVCFNRKGILEDLVARTHIVIVYDGKNTEASSIAVRSLLPQKKKCVNNGKQSRASFQGSSSLKEIGQPTKRFADCVKQKFCFCSVSKKELPGSAYPDESPRSASFMTVRDFSKAVSTLFSEWEWGEYIPYFTGTITSETESDEKIPDPV